jgi:GTP cyclohydrolase I
MSVDRDAAERAIRAFLKALGHDPETDATLRETPSRVAEAFERDLLAGYSVDVPGLLVAESELVEGTRARGLVVVKDISVATICPHHLLPGLGKATVAYLPGPRLVGIGTLARIVDAFARRLTLQETIGESVVQALVSTVSARGALCRIELIHSCLAARGARETSAKVITVATAGERIADASLGGVS